MEFSVSFNNKFNQVGDVVDRPRSGRPRVTDAREDRAMLMENCRNPFRSVAETARATIGHHGRRISDRTVRRRLHAVELFFSPTTEKAFYDGLPPPLQVNLGSTKSGMDKHGLW